MKVKTHTIEIFVDDLKEEPRREVLKALDLETPQEANLDIVPLTVVPRVLKTSTQ